MAIILLALYLSVSWMWSKIEIWGLGGGSPLHLAGPQRRPWTGDRGQMLDGLMAPNIVGRSSSSLSLEVDFLEAFHSNIISEA